MNQDKNCSAACQGEFWGTVPECPSLAFPYVPFQRCDTQKYTQKEALENGTLFKGLNLPFHAKKQAGSLRSCPMTELQALDFVVLELGLYLDTHPNDQEAFALYRRYAGMAAEARELYQAENSRPLTKSAVAFSKEYNWLTSPWPWQLQTAEGAVK